MLFADTTMSCLAANPVFEKNSEHVVVGRNLIGTRMVMESGSFVAAGSVMTGGKIVPTDLSLSRNRSTFVDSDDAARETFGCMGPSAGFVLQFSSLSVSPRILSAKKNS